MNEAGRKNERGWQWPSLCAAKKAMSCPQGLSEEIRGAFDSAVRERKGEAGTGAV